MEQKWIFFSSKNLLLSFQIRSMSLMCNKEKQIKKYTEEKNILEEAGVVL
jgi:hypothetical protein